MAKSILVTGATGAQGGALVPLLLAKGFQVRALTRNPNKPAAQALTRQGVEVVAGDMDDEASLERACADMYGVFAVQNFWEKGVGHEREVEQGCKLARAAKKANVQHFVQTSVANCDNAKGVLHFESKHKIETYIDSLNLPRTFLREVFFLDNFTQPVMTSGNKKSMDPFWVLPSIIGLLDDDTPFHMIAVEEIAWFAADVFQHPESYLGKHLDVAGDVLTPKQMKTLITRAGPGTKVVCLGNIAQIDTPYLTEGSSGLTYVVDRFKNWAHNGHITLVRGERSRLADFAAEVL